MRCAVTISFQGESVVLSPSCQIKRLTAATRARGRHTGKKPWFGNSSSACCGGPNNSIVPVRTCKLINSSAGSRMAG